MADFTVPPTIFAPFITSITKNERLLFSIKTGRRATIIVNRGGTRVYLGTDVGVSELTGFLLRPNEAVAVATAAEVWGTPGRYSLLTLSQ